MKNVILFIALMFAYTGLKAQSQTATNSAVDATETLAQRYQLDASQKADLLKIQERKYRNLSEVEPLRDTDPGKYVHKISAMQQDNARAIELILRKDQIQIFRQDQLAFREKKAEMAKELKSNGVSQQEISYRLAELDLEALK